MRHSEYQANRELAAARVTNVRTARVYTYYTDYHAEQFARALRLNGLVVRLDRKQVKS